jgi:perosamine synthetase
MRYQPPAHSPIDARALARGLASLMSLDPATVARVSGELCGQYHAEEALLVDSGTTALRLVLGTGSEASEPVAVPAFACYDIASAVIGARRRALLYDIDPTTLAPDLASLRQALEAGAATVVIAHLYAYPVDADEVASLCKSFGALLIEDAAQGAGGRLHGRPLGSFGSLSVLSFGRGKGMTAGGGGALLAHDGRGRSVLEWARTLLGPAALGAGSLVRLIGQWAMARPSLYAIPAAVPFLRLGETIYHPPTPARAMPRTCLAVLAQLLQTESPEVEARRRTAQRVLASLLGTSMESVRPVAAAEPGFLRLAATRPAGARPIDRAARRLGIMTSYPSALHELGPFWGSVINRNGALFPGARALAERLITLPTHSLLAESDLAALETWIHSCTGLR